MLATAVSVPLGLMTPRALTRILLWQSACDCGGAMHYFEAASFVRLTCGGYFLEAEVGSSLRFEVVSKRESAAAFHLRLHDRARAKVARAFPMENLTDLLPRCSTRLPQSRASPPTARTGSLSHGHALLHRGGLGYLTAPANTDRDMGTRHELAGYVWSLNKEPHQTVAVLRARFSRAL